MHPLLFKILVLIPLLALLGILTYKKINESFDNPDDSSITTTTIPVTTTTPQTTTPAELISTQLTTGIASSLGVSVRRITNLNYSGDISTQTLAVSFTVLDPNLIETSKNELAAVAAANYANALFTQGNFIVPINKINVRLTKMNQTSNVSNVSNMIGTPTMDPASYFNNKGLLDTANYAKQVYDTVPVDSAATRFFTLQPDSNFNLMPVMPTSTT
jgi:hypothetical protein